MQNKFEKSEKIELFKLIKNEKLNLVKIKMVYL